MSFLRPSRRSLGSQQTTVQELEDRVLLTQAFDFYSPSRSLLITLDGDENATVEASDDGLVLVNGSVVTGITPNGNALAAADLEYLSIRGGVDRNIIDARSVLRPVFPNLRFVIIHGGSGSDRILGSHSGANTMSRQLDIPNRLYGDGGNDVIHGGGARDALVGGTGNDQLFAWFGHDFLAGGSGDDYLSGGPQNDLLLGQDGDDNIHGETGDDTVNGGNGNDIGGTGKNNPGDADTIRGTGIDFLYGGPGNDHLFGFQGENLIFGGDGDDTLGGNEDSDTIYGGRGDDFLLGGDGNDRLNGENGNDQILGHSGDDVIWGGNGDDFLHGDTGEDTILGGMGSDMLYGMDNSDWMDGGGDDDTIQGGDDNDWLFGGEGFDVLLGQSGRDSLYGADGDDILRGQGGSGDLLVGGLGRDLLDGGPGNDRLYSDPWDDPDSGRFDFGDYGSAVQPNFALVDRGMLFTSERGYGLDSLPVPFAKNAADDLKRDGFRAGGFTFRVATGSGEFCVRSHSTSVGINPGSLQVALEGGEFLTINSSVDTSSQTDLTVRVVDGFLDIRFVQGTGFNNETGFVQGVEIVPSKDAAAFFASHEVLTDLER